MSQTTKNILVVDTSTDMLCAAVGVLSFDSDEGTVSCQMLASADHLCRRQSNVELVESCQKALQRANLTMTDIDSILVGRGPGSFTGVRIGIATAKGISCASDKGLYGASTLDGFAFHAWTQGVRGRLCVLADAMRGEVYPGIYELSETDVERCFGVEEVVKLDACIEHLCASENPETLQITGDALYKYQSQLEEVSFSNLLPQELWHPSGEGLLRAAYARAVFSEQAGDPALVLPIYTRLSDAEEAERVRLGLSQSSSLPISGTADALANRHIQYRPMSINDLEQIVTLEVEAFEKSPSQAWSASMFSDALFLPKSSWWVAHDEGVIIGFAGGCLAGDFFEVADVVVARPQQRQGIASSLLERLAYDAQMLNAQALSLEVYEHNNPALNLYQNLGFEPLRTREDYYGKGYHAIVMDAQLPLSSHIHTEEQSTYPQKRIWPRKQLARSSQAQQKLEAAGALILAIESSCDETAVAVISESGQLYASIVATQIDFHARFGGVVPEIASRKHTEAIVATFEEALDEAARTLECEYLSMADISSVAVTAGPGLVGALVVGVAFAKGLCFAADCKLIAVNHLEGHLFANLFETPDLEPPFIASLVSGGNTMLVLVKDWGDYQILGETIDDAVGEAFDKVSKALGLGYPGGPIISKLAAQGNSRAITFPRAMLHSGDYRFSLSGLKTAVITYIEAQNAQGRAINLPDLAASFEAAALDVQVAKARQAVLEYGVRDFCVGGGVAANPTLRAALIQELEPLGVRVTVPPLSLCGDNAAMIGLVGAHLYQQEQFAELDLDANPNMRLEAPPKG